MQMVKIQIPNKQESAKGLVEISGKARVLCFADDVYIVPEPALSLLNKMGITYQELGRGGFDYAEKALRGDESTGWKLERESVSRNDSYPRG